MERCAQIDVKMQKVNVHERVMKKRKITCKVDYVCGDGNTVML